ncbi:MAG: GAF domain-containing protein [Anaerolineae bacterium]|nr:GAF domain-containing protein [Anaerolineae bacterium]
MRKIILQDWRKIFPLNEPAHDLRVLNKPLWLYQRDVLARYTAEEREMDSLAEIDSRRVETIYRITSQLSTSLDLDHVLNRALTLVVGAVGVERASILMLDAQTLAGSVEPSGQLIHRAALGTETKLPPGGIPTRFHRGEGLVGWVIEHREAAIVPDIRRDHRWVEPRERCPELVEGRCPELVEGKEREYRSALAVPLLSGAQVLGALLLFHIQSDFFDEDHLRLVEAAAVQVSNAISNAALYGMIRGQAERLGSMLKTQQVEAAKSQAVLEGVADGVMVADARGKVILLNDDAYRKSDQSGHRGNGSPNRGQGIDFVVGCAACAPRGHRRSQPRGPDSDQFGGECLPVHTDRR